jgi:hypothetical protein
MAIPITNSQGTKAYLVPQGTTVTTQADRVTAIGSGVSIDCIQTLGDISTSRNVQEYTCLSSDESSKSLGSITLPSLDVNLIFDADNTTGQKEIRDMYGNNSRRVLIVEASDGDADLASLASGDAYPTTVAFEVAISKFGMSFEKDNAVMQMATIEISSKPSYIYYDAASTVA